MNISSMYNNKSDSEYDDRYLPMTTSFQITSGLLISVLILLAFGGNLLTLVVYFTDRKLCSVYDFFIFNLAITDMSICCFSMPFYAVYTLKGFYWEFGSVFCKIWLVVDFTLCMESILLMLILSMDRLALVTLGPYYTSTCTKLKSKLVVCISWLISFLLYGPAIIGWEFWVGYSTVDVLECDVEFSYSFEFTTVTAIVEFIVPVICLAIINVKIYRTIRDRSKLTTGSINTWNSATKVSKDFDAKGVKLEAQLNHKTKMDSTTTTDELNCSSKCHQNDTIIINDNHVTFISDQYNVGRDTQNGPDIAKDRVSINSVQTSDTLPENGKLRSCEKTVRTQISTQISGTSEDLVKTMVKNKERSRLKRDYKATRFLAMLVVVFLVCWAPYTITTIIVSFCESLCIHSSVYEAMNWLLWAKSAVNPFLYAMNSSRYRANFRKNLFCWKPSVRPINTEITCQTTGQR